MTIDKTWISKERGSREFKNGLLKFIEIAKNHVDSLGRTLCPCVRCCNGFWQYLDIVYAHVHDNGFQRGYTTWNYHGEKYANASEIAALFAPRARTQATRTQHEMFDVIDDVMAEINTNTENVPEDVTRLDGEFDALFNELNTELYPGCSWMSSLNFIAKLLHIKVLNKWTNSSFDQLLEFLRVAFPKENHIPASHYEAKKKLRKIGLGYESIHACINDCALFWKENEKMQNCPVCKESRWVDKDTKGKKVPQKVLRYFPLTPRLQRRYSSKFTAKDMIWHKTGRSTDGMMRHPVDGKAWQEFDERYPSFAQEPRNVRLGLAADGFNPFGNMSQSYSMWPVVLTNYNTPPWLCMKESSFMLTLLIPGPKSPGKDIDVYLKPLVDELKDLWHEDGVQTRDASTNTIFRMRATLLWTINDYPARSYMSGWSGQGYKACPTCNIDTPSCPVTNKIAYVGHRRFLSKKNKLRDDLSFNGKKETRDPPRRLTNTQILNQLRKVHVRVPGKHPKYGGVKRKREASELNWTKRSIFFELEYWSSLLLKHNLDVMHVEKNVCESLLGTLLMNDKSKDTHKARKDLQNMGIRSDLWLKTINNKVYQPQASYSFKPQERERFCQFIKGVRLPDGFGSNFRNKVISNYSNLIGLKSHDHHILMQRLLPIGVRAGLATSKNVITTINDLSTFFQKICARSINVSDMYKTNKEVIKLLCNLELIFPPAFFDIMVHLILHLPEEAILGGPVHMRWMYPFERYMKKLKAYVRNKARPEGSIAEGYVADEALTFCSMYLEGMQTRFNRPDRNADSGMPKRWLHVFSSQCRPMSKKKILSPCDEAINSLHWFVLDNCVEDEIKVYKSEFVSEHPGLDMKKEFPSWFKLKLPSSSSRLSSSSSSSSSTPDNTKELRVLAHGPLSAYSYSACIVNGVRFVVHSRDVRRTTQNSGVLSVGEDNTPFYGQLEEIIELNYLDSYSVVIFRCKWFKTSGKRLIKQNNMTFINISDEWYKDDQLILATQAKQVFYLEDPSRTNSNWRVVEEVHHRKLWDHPSINVVNEIDIMHDTQSSDYNLVVDSGCEVGESSTQIERQEVDVLPDSEPFFGKFVVDLGYLPCMTTTLEEDGDPNVNDEGFIDDDSGDEDSYHSDEDDEISEDSDDNERCANGLVESGYCRMADVAGSYHGGDGGGRPPHENTRGLESACESSKTNKRGKGRNLNTINRKAAEGKLPIVIDTRGGGCRFVGSNHSNFIRCISNTVRRTIPSYYASWEKVPMHYKEDIYPVLFDYFDLDSWKDKPEWIDIARGINAECQAKYSGRKSELKCHFDDVGGYDDVETALQCPPDGMDPAAWAELLHRLFLTEDFRKRSEANKKNRAKQRYPSRHGSKAYACSRREGMDDFQIFKKMHTYDNGDWINAAAEEDYGKLEDEVVQMTNESAEDANVIDNVELFKRALGPRRGHVRGMGRVTRQPSYDISISHPPPPQWHQQMNQTQEIQRQQEERINQQQQTIQELQRQMQEQAEMFRQLQQQRPPGGP
ncbi:hypothetical protein QVD17_26017 [Tagetes erecta]|uniref:Transposase n=1 Tax=Tagetes erecta TaxID=13708 RepID=A0AAD8NQF3_TARER|nr:hypothetical protein QVD17_26017 [Tagetes erecta]